jgi:extracellular elastinolytic metalloproteinase
VSPHVVIRRTSGYGAATVTDLGATSACEEHCVRSIRPPSRRARSLAATGAASAVLLALAPTLPSFAAQDPAPRGRDVDVQGERRGHGDADRRGRASSTAAQQAAAKGRARFGAFGTPEVVVDAGRPLATGLPADPEAAARAYLARERALFGLSQEQVDALEVVAVNRLGKGAAVLLRQVFGDLRTAHDGLVSVGVVDGTVVSVTSSLTRGTAKPQAPQLTAQQAADVVRRAGAAKVLGEPELVALPVPSGARSAWQVVTGPDGEGDAEGFTTYVDAVTGEVLLREDLVDHAVDDPTWKVFPNNPPVGSSADTRTTWSLSGTQPGSTEAVRDPASGQAWDVLADVPTHTTMGNSARTAENQASSSSRTIGARTFATSSTRTYAAPFTDQWRRQRCDPATLDSPAGADVEAAMANLFAMHNRMHDWSYGLGFTETAWNLQEDNFGRGGLGLDSEQGNAQAGARDRNVRDNANQFTPPDGQKPITNMYMWQPIAGAFYAPCVDGDYDMSVIGHEYGHAISNRMVAGPDAGLIGPQAGAMGESWSDLVATEYAREFGYRNAGATPYVVGTYVTGDPVAGIRNYDMSRSPLNYTDVGYDMTGPQVHADGEIWSATNHALREALTARHGAGTPALQRACALGQRAYDACPGNRRWMQLVFDSFLLMAQSRVSMVDARDALLSAELLRTGGADQALLRAVFASRGLGVGASSTTNADPDPVASFATGTASDGTITFKGAGEGSATPLRFYVGDHEARAVPVADTDPATALDAAEKMTPGTYRGLVVGAGVGHTRFTFVVKAGQVRDVAVSVTPNLASAAAGAQASGDGVNADKLIDETEGTNWASRDAGPVAGKGVTVDLAGDRAELVERVQVSAALRPAIAEDADTGGQNRYTALRSFRLLACDATRGADCSQPRSYTAVYTSPADAFPSTRPRPRVADLALRSFDVPSTRATHLRLEVVASQCTGGPDFAGEQDDDPRSATDCTTASAAGDDVRAAELQVFTR